jgi:hypothetical protein
LTIYHTRIADLTLTHKNNILFQVLKVNESPSQFEVTLDVSHYLPEELKVRLDSSKETRERKQSSQTVIQNSRNVYTTVETLRKISYTFLQI